jgi:hypothetical protein
MVGIEASSDDARSDDYCLANLMVHNYLLFVFGDGRCSPSIMQAQGEPKNAHGRRDFSISPMPPRPRGSITRYGPSRAPDERANGFGIAMAKGSVSRKEEAV